MAAYASLSNSDLAIETDPALIFLCLSWKVFQSAATPMLLVREGESITSWHPPIAKEHSP